MPEMCLQTPSMSCRRRPQGCDFRVTELNWVEATKNRRRILKFVPRSDANRRNGSHLRGQYFTFGALYPSQSDWYTNIPVRPYTPVSVGQYFIFGALCPSKSGLMNKHIVKP